MPTLADRLGFSSTDRLLIPHIDDAGLCESVNEATFECLNFGIATCCSVMVPAPGFKQFSEMAAGQGRLDIGVHLTLTSESQSLRWPSVTGDPSLHGPDGFMWPSCKQLERHVSPVTAKREMKAQIEATLAAGIDVTHLDAHMYAALSPRFMRQYLELAQEYQVPAMYPRRHKLKFWKRQFPPERAAWRKFVELDIGGYPFVDTLVRGTLPACDDKVLFYQNRVSGLDSGVHFMVTHPAADREQPKGLASARGRIQDLECLTDGTLKAHIQSESIRTIGFRAVRDWFRRHLASDPQV